LFGIVKGMARVRILRRPMSLKFGGMRKINTRFGRQEEKAARN
jgi:hypothetical protein